MSTTILRSAVAAALLFISAGAFAQVPVENAGQTQSPGWGMPGRATNPAPPQSAASGNNGGKGPGEFQPVPAEDKTTGGPQAIYALDKEYRVGANDLLDVEVTNLDNGRRTVRVNAAGAITMPLIGSVVVAGLTQEQVETHLATLYGEKYLQNPQVAVFIKEFTTQRITLDGAIAKPGIYPLVGHMTLLRVIALGGGFGAIANQTEVKVFRQGTNGKRQVATFDIERIRAGKDDDPMIQGDDVIVVQRDVARALLKDSIFRDVVDSINPFSVLAPR